MMETKFTKGEWRFEEVVGSSNWRHLIIAEGKTIAALDTTFTNSYEQTHANAKLISAAPEMLQFIIEMSERYANSEWIADEAQKVIKKATL